MVSGRWSQDPNPGSSAAGSILLTPSPSYLLLMSRKDSQRLEPGRQKMHSCTWTPRGCIFKQRKGGLLYENRQMLSFAVM